MSDDLERWKELADDLYLPGEGFHEQAREAFIAGNVIGMLISFSNELSLDVVYDNMGRLMARGIFERALVEAFTATRTNNARHSLDDLVDLLDCGAQPALREAGDPMPEGETFTLYRGVAGKGKARRVRGLSWTDDLAKAAVFAKRTASWGLADPAVYKTTAHRNLIYFYWNRRNEREFVHMADRVERLPAEVLG